jgi:hypothetical protein
VPFPRQFPLQIILEVISACWDEYVDKPLRHHHPSRLLSKMSQVNRFCLQEANKYIWRCITIRHDVEGPFGGPALVADFKMMIRDKARAALIQNLSLSPGPYARSDAKTGRRIINLLMWLPNLQHLTLGYRLENLYEELQSMHPNLDVEFPFTLKTYQKSLSHSDFVAPWSQLKNMAIEEAGENDGVPED